MPDTSLARKVINYRDLHYAVNYFRRFYGFSKMLKGVTFISYRLIREIFLSLEEEHIANVNGYKLTTIPNDSGISNELLIFKTHEPLSTEVLKTELKKGMVCLDIGANIGYYTLLERKLVGNRGKVIAIEPSPLTFSYLTKNVHLNRFSDIDTFNIALSSSDGEVPFLVGAMSNLSKVAIKTDSYPGSSLIKVPARSLDSFVSQNGIEKLDFLRMDVEGHEKEIIKGGFKAIKEFKPILHLEVHNSILGFKRTINFLYELRNLGYSIKYYIPRELDIPFIGSKKDILTADFDMLLRKSSDCKLPATFHLLLE